MNTAKQVIGALGDLGHEIIKETANVPVEMLGMKLEQFGTPKKNSNQQIPTAGEKALMSVTNNPNPETKRARARAALQEFVGTGKPKEPDAWEKKKKESLEKAAAVAERKKQERSQALPQLSTKRKQGQRYGIHEKTTEASKNVKAE
jgi:hypothetical protein